MGHSRETANGPPSNTVNANSYLEPLGERLLLLAVRCLKGVKILGLCANEVHNQESGENGDSVGHEVNQRLSVNDAEQLGPIAVIGELPAPIVIYRSSSIPINDKDYTLRVIDAPRNKVVYLLLFWEPSSCLVNRRRIVKLSATSPDRPRWPS